MPFVKLDCGILDSTLWVDLPACRMFETALLMAVPREICDVMPQFAVRTLDPTGWVVPPGWYGFVAAAGVGIVRRAHLDEEDGLAALERLGAPDPGSRSADHDGRRLVRVTGGYVVLNFQVYRDRDYTNAERCRRYRGRENKRTQERRRAAKKQTREAVDTIRQRPAADVPDGVIPVTGEDKS
jgi:hypothetical protein